MRKILPGEFEQLSESLYSLAEILDAVGVAEFSKSRKTGEIHWDTANGAQIDPRYLQEFCEQIDWIFDQWSMNQSCRDHDSGHRRRPQQ